jgi:hypothetical protein
MPTLFVPTTGGGNGWGSGFGALADALAAAPANRARMRQMELEAARSASQMAIEQERLKLAQETAAREAASALLNDQLNKQKLQQGAATFPLEQQKLQGEIKLQGPTYDKGLAEATTAQIGARKAGDAYEAIPQTRLALTDQVMAGVMKNDPLKLDLSPPPKEYWPTLEAQMNTLVPGASTSGTPDVYKQLDAHDDIRARVWALSADPTLHGDGGVPGDWVEKTTEDALAGLPGASASDAGTWSDTSVEGQALNVVLEYNMKKAQGVPTTPQEDQNYTLAYQKLGYGDRMDTRQDPATGAWVPVKIPGAAPPGVVAPGAAQPAATVTQVQTPPAQTPAPSGTASQPQAAPETGGNYPLTPPVQAPGSLPPNALTNGKPPEPTAAQDRTSFLAATMDLGTLDQVIGYDDKTRTVQFNDRVPGPIGMDLSKNQYWKAYAPDVLQPPGSAKAWTSSLFATIDPIVRTMTGAALNPSELPNYIASWTPQSGNPPELNAHIMWRLHRVQEVLTELGKDARFRTAVKMDPKSPEAAQARAMFEQMLSQTLPTDDVKELLYGIPKTPAPGQAPPPAAGEPQGYVPANPTGLPPDVDLSKVPTEDLLKLIAPSQVK